jgi:hypothetical protein
MLNLQAVADLIGQGAELYRHYVPPDRVPYPNLMAIGVAGVGILLAFWGARLLRTIYILGFMVVGAAEGFRIGSNLGIDTLIGLTFGAGIAGLIGYVLFRWWVGVTAGTVAALVVLALVSPQLVPLNEKYQDFGLGVGSDVYRTGNGQDAQDFKEYLVGFSQYLWTQHKDFAGRFAVGAGLAWLLGVILGLVLPRFTTILGTSLFGVLMAAGGGGVLLYRNWPEAWSAVSSHPDWYLVGLGAFLIVSAWRQTRSGRMPAAAPAPAPPADAPPAPAK